jgi:transcriptional regulator with XRE-family HTH domain
VTETNLLGRRIAALRADRGWSQERLAGLLHVEPLELVDGAAYPQAKAERLPAYAPATQSSNFSSASSMLPFTPARVRSTPYVRY